ncbi:MAG: radical SAM protein [Elusimicrobia bacterium]|nr:radical SAM protein [Elusimicrobiota bacterium]
MGRFYTKTKIFHFKDKLDSLPKDKKEILPPIHVRVKPTNACNHNCSYCSYRADGLQLGKDMRQADSIPKAKMLEILEDFRDMGVRAVTFSGGGEPFCYPHLLDAARFLAGTDISFASLTNGSRLTGELAALFARHATWLRVSVDGWDEESYSSYRKVPRGEFAKVLKNIEGFKKLPGGCHLGVSLIIDQRNAPHVREMIGRFRALGADSVKASGCVVSDSVQENNAYHKAIFASVKEQIQRARSDFAGQGFEIFDAYHELDDKFRKSYGWCPYLQILPVIGADLNIYPCQDKAYNLAEGLLGSIKERRFKDFWSEGKAKFFKIDPRHHCDHHCVANLKNEMILEYLDADHEHIDFV